VTYSADLVVEACAPLRLMLMALFRIGVVSASVGGRHFDKPAGIA
jgi:hypothetical protein